MSKPVLLPYIFISLLCLIVHFCIAQTSDTVKSWIRVNQLGYAPGFNKVAVFCSKENLEPEQFTLLDATTGTVSYQSRDIKDFGSYGPFNKTFRMDFSAFSQSGRYIISATGITSPPFEISAQVYDQTADFLLQYMRQQRCGYNPFLQDSCHRYDGYTMYGPMPDSSHIDVTGGWHDASDYLQYTATSANATYQMLLAYQDHPFSFSDHYDADGNPGANGLADILDEANWGLDWLVKMHPRPDWMFNQIADDRDHTGFHLPTKDSISYGKGLERPVYFCSGDIQGLLKYQNRTTGTASTAGKYTSAFALAARMYRILDSVRTNLYHTKAVTAYKFGIKKPGVCQTAPCRAPYFYEEDNWHDDMELGAAELFALTGDSKYLADAEIHAAAEPVTPWLGADTARHYQWYPFLNLGHYRLSDQAETDFGQKVLTYYRDGIEKVWSRARSNAFLMGVPYIWCSNNLVTALVTQCYLYRKESGDKSYIELESAMRDWLFGCNPWGISMIIDLPAHGRSARDPHSAFTHLHNYKISGGLLDGPVYTSIYHRLKYIQLREDDEFAPFQSELAVYHDDVGDYATNEPTMDGTASLIYYLAAMQNEAGNSATEPEHADYEYNQGAIVRGNINQKKLALVFTGDQFANGAETIIRELKKRNLHASFFLTGNFYRDQNFSGLIKKLRADGHYLGAHSNAHLLYCDWQERSRLLLTRSEFQTDLHANYLAMAKHGIAIKDVIFFLPPYEWYNQQISNWTQASGLQLINYTPGTLSHADYTIPSMGSRYYSSDTIFNSITDYESSQPGGLNGFILLMHIGAHPERTDLLHDKFGILLEKLISRGYQPVRIDRLLR